MEHDFARSAFDMNSAGCKTFTAAGIPCMTAGGKDGWPIFVGAYGLLGSAYPDQGALVEGLWNGSIKYTDQDWLDLLGKYQVYDRDMMEAGASGVGVAAIQLPVANNNRGEGKRLRCQR